jgi:hypothetical protein
MLAIEATYPHREPICSPGQGSPWFLHTFNTLIENMRAPTTIADTQKKTSRPFFVRLVLLHFHLGFLTHYA